VAEQRVRGLDHALELPPSVLKIEQKLCNTLSREPDPALRQKVAEQLDLPTCKVPNPQAVWSAVLSRQEQPKPEGRRGQALVAFALAGALYLWRLRRGSNREQPTPRQQQP
jgi:hypothetical protein